MEKPKVKLGEVIDIAAAAIAGSYLNNIPYQPIYMEGTTGIGKTQMVELDLPKMIGDKTKTEGWEVITLKLSYYTSADILGMPIVNNTGEYPVVEYIKENILPRPGEGRKGIIFLDEIPLVTNGDVRSALYDLLQNNKLGSDYRLPENWFVIGAGNRREDSGVYNELSPALRDRVMMFEVEFDKNGFVEHMIKKGSHPTLIKFLQSVPSRDIHTFSAEDESNLNPNNEIFSTPRSFENASDKLKLYELGFLNMTQLRYSLKSIIGDHADKIMEMMSGESEAISQLANWSVEDPENPLIDILADSNSDLYNEALTVLKNGSMKLENRLNIAGFLVYQGIPETMISKVKSYFGVEELAFNVKRAEVETMLTRNQEKGLYFG